MLRKFLPKRFSSQSGIVAVFGSVGIQIIILGLNLVTGTVIARTLGPTGRGAFVVITLWPQLLAGIALAGSQNALVFLLKRHPDQTKNLIAAAFLIIIFFDALLVAIAYSITDIYLKQYDADIRFWSIVSLPMVFINSTQMILKQSFAGMDQFAAFNLCNLLPQLFYLFLLLPILYLFPTPVAASAALYIGGIPALLIVVPVFLRIVTNSTSSQQNRSFSQSFYEFFSYSLKSCGVDIVNTISSYLDRLILIPIINAEQMGLYAVGYSLSRVVLVLLPAINVVVFSRMSGLSITAATLLHDQTLRATGILLSVFCCTLPLIDVPLIELLFGSKFEEAAYLFRILCFEASLSCLAQIPIVLFLTQGMPGFVSLVQALYLSICLVLVASFAIRFGAIGAAAGLLVASILRFGMLYIGIKSALKLPLPRLIPKREDFSHFRRLIFP